VLTSALFLLHLAIKAKKDDVFQKSVFFHANPLQHKWRADFTQHYVHSQKYLHSQEWDTNSQMCPLLSVPYSIRGTKFVHTYFAAEVRKESFPHFPHGLG
jgi:hypothetical protein